MPFVSKAQRGWAHTVAGTKALGGPGKVKEWDQSSKGATLPDHVAKKNRVVMRRYGPTKKRSDVVAPAALK